MDVTQTITILVHPGIVWGVLKDFGAIQKWIPKISKCAVTGTSSGITRHIQSDITGHSIESLETINEQLMILAYRVLQGPEVLKDCLITISVIVDTENSLVQWVASSGSAESGEESHSELLKEASRFLAALKHHCELDMTSTPLKKLKPNPES
jgi:hypothetical protein